MQSTVQRRDQHAWRVGVPDACGGELERCLGELDLDASSELKARCLRPRPELLARWIVNTEVGLVQDEGAICERLDAARSRPTTGSSCSMSMCSARTS